MRDESLPLQLGPLRDEDIVKLSPQGNAFQKSLNEIPTTAEVFFAQSRRTVAESELHQLHHDLVILQQRQAQLLTFIKVCDTVLAPHKKLPPELMSKIFCFVIPHSAMFPLKKDMRLHITQVCSRWRRIAFDTPALWNLRFPHFYENSKLIDLGASWWSQCSGSFLKVATMQRPTGVSMDQLDSSLIEKLVLPFSNRLRKIQMRLSVRDFAQMMSAPPGSYGNLELLALKVDGKHTEPWVEPGSALLTSHNLHSIILSIPEYFWFKPRLTWESLSRLTLISKIPGDICLIIMSQCSSLTSCNLSIIDDPDDQDLKSTDEGEVLPPLPLSLPLLNSFSVQFRTGIFSPFLSHFALPNLSKFIITTGIMPHGHHWTRGCETFFKVAGPSLKNVEVKSSFQSLIFKVDSTIFSYFPNIRSFISPLNHRFETPTMEKIGRGELLPQVETIQFHAEHTSDVMDMLDARRSQALSSGSNVSIIRDITVACCESDEVDERLNILRTQGININHTMTYWSPDSDSDGEY
ncbi:hypothetical protein BDZ94DRAFT_1321805 [Collybia nuda]|uniref:F-box domain-containing protein n=1 Tax=Collybia nuda TaxID=64659 RepID=A0A9P5Y552_9AGAR|nr:hypothetical protein BDZ94DRAFT_1321805 [Collybia nuda]